METSSITGSEPPLIVARDIAMSFGSQRVALRGVTCDVRRGEFIAILGPSGCGKSTLLRLIAGLMASTEGSLTIAGQPPETARRASRRVAFVFQEPNLL